MTKETILEKIKPVLDRYDVPLRLISAIIQVESSWNPQAKGDYIGGQPTSFGLFQLHRGGQAPADRSDEELRDPVLNTRYAMPSIASAWDQHKGWFDPSSQSWWLKFAAASGHPGGSDDDPATQHEARALQETYAALGEAEYSPSGSITTDRSYTVRPGDTLSAIARRFDMSLSALEAANPQIRNPNLIQAGEMLHIPILQETRTSSPAPTAGSYMVQPGDTLSAIAQRFGVSLEALEAANPQIVNPNVIQVGEMLNIPNQETAQRTGKGEVAVFSEADQFLPGKTQLACGFFACAMALSMAPIGQQAKFTSQQITEMAEQWYAKYEPNNWSFMSDQQTYDLLQEIKLDYQVTSEDINIIERWVEAGYPVLVSLEETSVFDMELGHNPYTSWPPAGYHMILVTGVTGDGNVLCRDSANCTDLHIPNTLRRGPRKYKASSMKIRRAIAVAPPWYPRPIPKEPLARLPEPRVISKEPAMIDLSNPWVKVYFTQVSTNPDRWTCTNGKSLFAGMLHGWRLMNGAPRLPIGDEVHVPGKKSAVYQRCEGGILLSDPDKELDAPNGPWAPCYLLKLDSELAQKLLGIKGAVPVDSSKLTGRLTSAAAAIDEAQRVLKETSPR